VIIAALDQELGPSLSVPTAPRARELEALEDQLDALVCAWAGIECLAGRLEPLGDAQPAIWCPQDPAAGLASS
jgi:predicted RNase H-like nuclease